MTEPRHPLADVWELCDRLDEAANAATRAKQVRPMTDEEKWDMTRRSLQRSLTWARSRG